MEPHLLRRVLKKFIASNSLGESISQIELLTRWEEILSPILSKHAKPSGIREGELLIEVSSSAWMNELLFLKDELKNRLNEAVGRELIKGIRFYLKEE